MMRVKEEKLRTRYRDTHTALMWLRKNQHRFKGNVYEPMMLVVREEPFTHNYSSQRCVSKQI